MLVKALFWTLFFLLKKLRCSKLSYQKNQERQSICNFIALVGMKILGPSLKVFHTNYWSWHTMHYSCFECLCLLILWLVNNGALIEAIRTLYLVNERSFELSAFWNEQTSSLSHQYLPALLFTHLNVAYQRGSTCGRTRSGDHGHAWVRLCVHEIRRDTSVSRNNQAVSHEEGQ